MGGIHAAATAMGGLRIFFAASPQRQGRRNLQRKKCLRGWLDHSAQPWLDSFRPMTPDVQVANQDVNRVQSELLEQTAAGELAAAIHGGAASRGLGMERDHWRPLYNHEHDQQSATLLLANLNSHPCW